MTLRPSALSILIRALTKSAPNRSPHHRPHGPAFSRHLIDPKPYLVNDEIVVFEACQSNRLIRGFLPFVIRADLSAVDRPISAGITLSSVEADSVAEFKLVAEHHTLPFKSEICCSTSASFRSNHSICRLC